MEIENKDVLEMYELANKIHGLDFETPEQVEAVLAYEKRLSEIIESYGGPENTPAMVDVDRYNLYSDLYKDRNGVRPRSIITIAQMNEWLKNQ